MWGRYDALSPLDIERIFGLQNGCITHTSLALHQLAYNRLAILSIVCVLLRITALSVARTNVLLPLAQARSRLQHAPVAAARPLPLWRRLAPTALAILNSAAVPIPSVCCRCASWRRCAGSSWSQLRLGGAERQGQGHALLISARAVLWFCFMRDCSLADTLLLIFWKYNYRKALFGLVDKTPRCNSGYSSRSLK